jgi:hypothetical protein
LSLLAGWSDDDGAGWATKAAQQLADEAFDALVAASEAVVVDQILVDRLGVAALAERDLDEVEVGLAGAGRGAPASLLSRLTLYNGFLAAAHLIENDIGGSFPDERLGLLVPGCEPRVDSAFQFVD